MRVWVIIGLLLAGWVRVAGGVEASGNLRLQAGPEVDTNVRRVYQSQAGEIVSDTLARVILEGDFRLSMPAQRLEFGYHGGFKIFKEEESENFVVSRLRGAYRWQFASRWALGLRAGLQDTVLRVHDRDYRLSDAELFVGCRLLSWLDARIFAGGRHFLFKPDSYRDYELKFSHAGPELGLALLAFGAKPLSVSMQYRLGARFFDQTARDFIAGTVAVSARDRIDLRHTAGLRLRSRFRLFDELGVLVDLSYQLAYNDSNSHGSSAHWHRLQLVTSLQLPWEITLHLMGALQFNAYPDGMFVEGDLYDPDADENENSLVLRLKVPLGKRLGVFVQGALYRNEFHSQQYDVPPFRRETLMLGLSYDLAL